MHEAIIIMHDIVINCLMTAELSKYAVFSESDSLFQISILRSYISYNPPQGKNGKK